MLDKAERHELEELRARVSALEEGRARNDNDEEISTLDYVLGYGNDGAWIVQRAKWGWGIAIVGLILLWIVDTFIFRF